MIFLNFLHVSYTHQVFRGIGLQASVIKQKNVVCSMN